MNRFVRSLVLTAILAVGAGTLMAGSGTCKNSNFKGVYSALAKGEFIAGLGAPLDGPTTRFGRVEVDGKGNSRIHAVTSLNGVLLSEDYEGVYAINSDCTAQVTLQIPFPGVGIVPFTFKAVLSDNFQQFDMILASPAGSTVVLSLRQQNQANCSPGDLNGGYAVSMRGVVGLPFGPAAPYVRLGRMVFDGRGAFTAGTTVSNNGAISSETFTGTYTVDSSCFVSLSYGAGNTWSGMLMDNSTAANLIVTGPAFAPPGFPFPIVGSTVSGTLKKQ